MIGRETVVGRPVGEHQNVLFVRGNGVCEGTGEDIFEVGADDAVHLLNENPPRRCAN